MTTETETTVPAQPELADPPTPRRGRRPRTEPKPEAVAESGSIPPPPPMAPAAGDKTPAFVEWMQTYHPEQAAKRYRNRKIHNA